MGLLEKRIVQHFQKEVFPAQLERIQSALGSPVEVNVEWGTLLNDLQGVDKYSPEQLSDFWVKIFCEPVVLGVEKVASDDLGREALKEGLKKVHFCNKSGKFSAHSAISFQDGTLTIDHRVANTGEVAERAKFVQKVLEEGL